MEDATASAIVPGSNVTLDAATTISVCSVGHATASLAVRLTEWSLRVLGAAMIVGGVAGNSVTAYLQATERSHRGTTRFLMVFLALVDCAVLLLAVVRYWMTETLGLDIRDLHPLVCRLHQAAVATVSDLAVYTLCGIGVERFVQVAHPHWAGHRAAARNFSAAFGLLVLAICAKNAPIAFFRFTIACVRLLEQPAGGSEPLALNLSQLGRPPYQAYRLLPTRCSYDRSFGQWFAKLDVITFLIVPYTVLLVCNVYIYAAMRRQRMVGRDQLPQQQQQQAQHHHQSGEEPSPRQPMIDRPTGDNNPGGRCGAARKPESTMRILAVLTVIHICTTLPASVGQLLSVGGWLPQSETSRVALDALKTLMFANNATNFLAYFVSSRSFRDRVLRCGLRSRRERPTLEHASLCGAQPNSLRSEHEALRARNGEQLLGAASGENRLMTSALIMADSPHLLQGVDGEED